MTYPGYARDGIVVCEGPEGQTEAQWYLRLKSPKSGWTYSHFKLWGGEPKLVARWYIDEEGNAHVAFKDSPSR